jgi:hypothetical protein
MQTIESSLLRAFATPLAVSTKSISFKKIELELVKVAR